MQVAVVVGVGKTFISAATHVKQHKLERYQQISGRSGR